MGAYADYGRMPPLTRDHIPACAVHPNRTQNELQERSNARAIKHASLRCLKPDAPIPTMCGLLALIIITHCPSEQS